MVSSVWECDVCGEQICTAEEMARLKKAASKQHREMLDAILSEKSDDRIYIRIPDRKVFR